MQLVFLLGIWHWKKNYCKQINENPHWMKVSVSDSFAPYQSCNTDHDSWWRHYYVSPMLQQRWYTFHVFFIDWNFNLTEVLKSQGRDYHNGFQKNFFCVTVLLSGLISHFWTKIPCLNILQNPLTSIELPAAISANFMHPW